MSTAKLLSELDLVLDMLNKGRPVQLGAIPWASPVLAFGDPVTSKVATLGLNPSNLEFVDRDGNELQPPHHRFESLTTLGAKDWESVRKQDLRKVWSACEGYFHRNPYDQWFKQLEKVLVDTGASYYSSLGESACHLDLVPFATSKKWSALGGAEQEALVQLGTPTLVRTILASDIRVLILNGSTVVREFNRLIGDHSLQARIQGDWALQGGRVSGIAHIGRVSKLGALQLDRELLVLGYNHNIQSSFGVTNEVVSHIATWVGRSAAQILQ